MSDAEVQSLFRAAQTDDDGPGWLRLGHALTRVGRFDEAALSFLRAEEKGELVDVWDRLAAGAKDLVPRALASARSPVRRLAWSDCGRFVFGIEAERTLLAWDTRSGECRTVVPLLPGRVIAMSPAFDEARVAVAFAQRGDLDRRKHHVVSICDLVSGERTPPMGDGLGLVARIAFARGELSIAEDTPRLRVHRVSSGEVLDDRQGRFFLGRRGELWKVEPRRLSLSDRDVAFEHELATEGRIVAVGRRAFVATTTKLSMVGERGVVSRSLTDLLPEHERLVDKSRFEDELAWLYQDDMDAAYAAFGMAASARLAAFAPRSMEGALWIVDLEDGARVPVSWRGKVAAFAFAPSGRKLVLSTDLGDVVVLEVPSDVPAEGPFSYAHRDEVVLRRGDEVFRARREGAVVRFDGKEVRCIDAADASRRLGLEVERREREGFVLS